MWTTLKELWSSLDPKEKRYMGVGLILIVIIGFISIVIVPIVMSFPAPFEWMNISRAGTVGDAFNGMSGPFIALTGAILTFLAFYVQYKANIQQREQFKTELKNQSVEAEAQDLLWKTERFEGRFFELIKLHKANVAEMNIGDRVLGSKCFIPMFYELRYCYKIMEDYLKATDPQVAKANQYDRIDLMSLSYKIFFYGIGENSEKQYVNGLKIGEKHLFERAKEFITRIQKTTEQYFDGNPKTKYFKNNIGDHDVETEFYYYPYDGHVNRLGHYYRHLFQTVNYVIAQDFLDEAQRYSYIKTLRAQLSNFEQLLLYYNALAWFDDQWKEAFTTYRFIKNLPLPLADFGTTPEKHFEVEIKELWEKDIAMFELLE